MYRNMTMFAQRWNGGEVNPDLEWTLFAADIPANPTPQPGRCWETTTPAISGPHSLTPFAHYDPITRSWRTSQLTFDWDSTVFSPILPNSGSMRSGALFTRPLWVHHIEGPDCSYWPTPTSQNLAGGVGYQYSRAAAGTTIKFPTLTGAVRMSMNRPMQSPGLVNPMWVEWLMGLPLCWTANAYIASETP